MDFANVGRSCVGAELITQLSVEGGPPGTPLSRDEEAQEALSHNTVPLQSPLSDSLMSGTSRHPDPLPSNGTVRHVP